MLTARQFTHNLILKRFLTLCIVVTAIAAFQAAEVRAQKTNDKWNYETQITKTEGAFTYHAYLSEDGTEAWIHKIEINPKKKHSSLNIPKTIQERTVTRIGYTSEPYDFSDSEGADKSTNKNLFDAFIDRSHKIDGAREEMNAIKKVTIPDSIERIEPAAFSGMNALTEITIPKKVTVISKEMFYGCDRLKTIYLPANLKKIEVTAIDDCPKLTNIQLSSKNKVYTIKDSCVIEKQSQSLIGVLSYNGTLKIPEGVKTIRTHALSNCTSSGVYIPASVKNIENRAFHKTNDRENKNIKNVTVSKKNKVYAKDGQCIYNKTNKSLAVAIPDKNGTLKISDKIETLTNTYSVVNCDTWNKHLNKVTFSKNLAYAEVPAFGGLTNAKKVYFTGKTPPTVVRPENVLNGIAALPVFVDLYVPKKSVQLYKEWYKEHNCYSYLDSLHTF